MEDGGSIIRAMQGEGRTTKRLVILFDLAQLTRSSKWSSRSEPPFCLDSMPTFVDAGRA